MRITLPSGTPAELAGADRPAAGPAGGAPPAIQGLVLLPDIMGLRPLFDEHCARLATELDVVVVAPEPFPGLEHQPVEWRLGNAGAVPDPRRLGDIAAAAEATGRERLAVLGFCMGGMYALKAAGSGRFRRAVSFYGMVRVPADWRVEGTVEPLDALAAPGACPVLELVGTADPMIPEADLRDLEAAGATVVRYPGANHGFAHDPARPTHRPDDTADAWRRARAFLLDG